MSMVNATIRAIEEMKLSVRLKDTLNTLLGRALGNGYVHIPSWQKGYDDACDDLNDMLDNTRKDRLAKVEAVSKAR